MWMQNTIIDERASFAVPRPYPGPLANLLRSIKMVRSASESLREMVMSEQKKIIESSYAVSGILSSSTFGNTSRSENLMELLDNEQSYVVYRFNASCWRSNFKNQTKNSNQASPQVKSAREQNCELTEVRSASESLREMVMSEQKKIIESSYAVSCILSSSTFGNTSRSENLMELLDNEQSYVVYRFNASSCMFIDENGGNHEVDPDGFEKLKADKLSPFTANLVDGINQSETRRRALVVLCGAFLNVNAKIPRC